ncbi:MAG: TetR/AcrR family transcriptional regulator [Lachnospiraceae bacterium]|nr:TetR/AcrR family transcriptional regulator [Lachnospiraceae bacterium]
MGRNSLTTEYLKDCMADALIKLLKERSIDKITVQQITETAGVGRATWFRNFSNKNEAISFRLVRLWEKWAEEHELKERRSFSIDNAETFFLYNYEIKDMLLIIYQAGLQTSVYDAFYAIMVSENDDNPEERYRNRFYSYGLFGLLDEWIKRGFSESPDEMAKTLRRIVT